MTDKMQNIPRLIKQHLEMEAFFTGDFAVRGELPSEPRPPAAQETPSAGGCSAAEGLAAIEKEVRACCCGLNKTRTNPVPGEGNPNADIVFVGEAPCADEDAQGRPFVGRAGQLLNNIIAAMGLQRGDVFICNILKCRPPENRDPRPDEIIRCLPFLQRQLELIRPKVIVALGAHAARTLLKTELPIGKLRGRFHDYYISPDLPPVKLMPTYHPAYLLRNYSPENRRRVWQDMQKVMAELGMEVPKNK